ncbi:MAG TPA: hypothetical protein VK445_00160 [Dissulfurispiraceae bacterium]|nr:hypothetical protein [Dissulfurispiraceae bacterium]
MRHTACALLFFIVLACSQAFAEEVIAISGTIKSIDLATGSFQVTTYDSIVVKLQIADSETLQKFRDKRVIVGDDVKVKYTEKNNQNIVVYFRKPVGC